MSDPAAFRELSTCTLSDCLTRDSVMDVGIRPLWSGGPRIAGPAFPVRCPPGDNLMVHAAIYRAPAGSIVVVQAGDQDYAMAGGNVCAVAQKKGIAGFVLDGLIRDLAEVRENAFPVYARGVIPIPAGKDHLDVFNGTVICGGVSVSPGDMVVADEEGVVVVPVERIAEVLKAAQAKAKKDAAETLENWEKNHRAKIDEILKKKGFTHI
jgi:4-hydroxy-4-methyl-2-oxoglutarate aldolase